MRHRARFLIVFAALIFACTPGTAHDLILICAKNEETGQMYHAMASNATGADLNAAAHSSDYDPMGDYVVVSWTDTNFSIIQMEPPFSSPSYFPANGIDQDGHEWEVSLYSTKTCP